MSPLELVLSRVKNVRVNGEGWIARCPAHEDRRPSLSVSEGDGGRALVHCHAGCSVEAVVAALGLKLADLMPEKPAPLVPRPTAAKSKAPLETYPKASDAVAALEVKHGPRAAAWFYYNAEHKPVGLVARWDTPEGKTFRPVSRTANGWVIGAMPEPRPLYGLPELLQRRDEMVYVVEGEKAADAAAKLGLLATTSAGGAKAARKTDWTLLAGREVVLLPDHDEPGEKYAADVAELLAKLSPPAVVRTVHLAEAWPSLPTGGDMADIVEAGEDHEAVKAKLASLVDAAEPESKVSAVSSAVTNGLLIEHAPVGHNGTLAITVKRDGKPIYTDKLDIHRATARERAAKAITKACPTLRLDSVQNELLQIATAEATEPAQTGDEIDGLQITRPELFHRNEVSGVLVPIITLTGSEPTAKWALYLKWTDGRREQRDLTPSIELSGSGRLWFNPIPSPPSMSRLAGWSLESRRAWLNGEPAPEPADVFKSLCETTAYFLDFPAETAAEITCLLVLWVILTYAYPAWSAVPYLSIGGPLSSGKTRVFEVLGRLVFRPLLSANCTAPILFRALHESGGTLLLDEAERLREGTPDAGEIRSILLAGYKAGSPAQRLEPVGDGKFKTLTFDVYSPKALAGIAGLPEALASRSIRLMMFRALPDSPKPRRRIDEDPERWQQLRNDLHVMALEYGPTWLQLACRSDVCPVGLDGRSQELWQPILALAAWLEEGGAAGLLGLMQAFSQRVVESSRDETISDADETLLRILANSAAGGCSGGLTPAELLKQANEREPNVFGKWSTRGVAMALRRYGIKTTKSHGTRTFRDVSPSQLAEIGRRYGLDLGLPEPVQQEESDAPTPFLCAPSATR